MIVWQKMTGSGCHTSPKRKRGPIAYLACASGWYAGFCRSPMRMAMAVEELRTAEELENGAGEINETPASPRDWLFRLIPAIDSLRTYSLRSLRLDLFAGLTVAA